MAAMAPSKAGMSSYSKQQTKKPRKGLFLS